MELKNLFIKNHFIQNNFISSKMSDRPNRKNSNTKSNHYDDWVCLMCQNLNYSFRKTCMSSLIQAIDVDHKQSRTMII